MVIRASCSQCKQDCRLDHADVTLRMCKEDVDRDSYIFTCPICSMVSVKPADGVISQKLQEVGCKVVMWNLPLELLETPLDADLISLDDILDLNLELADEEVFWQHIGIEDEL